MHGGASDRNQLSWPIDGSLLERRRARYERSRLWRLFYVIPARKRLRLDANATIAGQPIKRIRELLRRIGDARLSDQEIADFFHIDNDQAVALIDEMSRRGFVQASARRSDGARFYECGPQGARLASARFLKPITRARAEAIMVPAAGEKRERAARIAGTRVRGARIWQLSGDAR